MEWKIQNWFLYCCFCLGMRWLRHSLNLIDAKRLTLVVWSCLIYRFIIRLVQKLWTFKSLHVMVRKCKINLSFIICCIWNNLYILNIFLYFQFPFLFKFAISIGQSHSHFLLLCFINMTRSFKDLHISVTNLRVFIEWNSLIFFKLMLALTLLMFWKPILILFNLLWEFL